MNEAIKNIGTLYNNPFVFGKIIHTFYSSYEKREKDILLSSLILPLSLYPASQEYLTQRKNPNSSLRILAKKNERIFGLQERVVDYRNITNITLQYAIDIGTLNVDVDMSIKIIKDWPTSFNFSPKKAITAAERLGEYMSKYDVTMNYQLLGVKEI